MRFKAPKIKIALAVLVILQSIVPPTTNGGERLARFKRLITESTYKGTEPVMGKDGAMECLAQNIDWLEHHIDTYGSVVAKQPDIWGEARLTKHRDEYERIMFGELGEFNNTINASIRQRDGAFLAQAFALSAAAKNTGAAPAIPELPPASVQVGNVIATLPGSNGAKVTDWKKYGITTDPANKDDPRIRLDPVTHLDQKSRYLKHLHELRRINEGDDTSDSPGYSLNLVRIPVSVLPGKLTRQGFGAEITVTVEPVISDDLMPTTFRNLVVNDVVDLLGLPLVRVTEYLQSPKAKKYRTCQADGSTKTSEKTCHDLDKETCHLKALALCASAASSPSGRARKSPNPLNPSSIAGVIGSKNLETIAEFFKERYYGRYIRWSGSNDAEACREHRVNLLDARKFLDAEIQAAYELLSQKNHLCLFAELAEPNSGLETAIRSGHFGDKYPSSKRVEKLRREFFANLHNTGSSGQKSGTSSPSAVPAHVIDEGSTFSDFLVTYRNAEVDPDLNPCCADQNTEARTPVEALAWAIVVESALLNERLNRDVRKLAKAKDAFSLNTTEDHLFFLPDTVTAHKYDAIAPANAWDPSDEELRRLKYGQDLQVQFQSANEVFKEYVRVRWPIHVFAVDPVNQDQNVADASARKRELQFALALGFTSGQIGSNSLTQFSRQLQTEVETISLNRTIVGFGHGADTFGWRFYPRVQALNVPGTFGAIRETIMGTSRDYDLRQRQIEPGQRECVAVVLMPSFVPYADFDIRTDWFKLTNPKNTALTMKDSLKLSRAVTAMRNSRATCAECQHLYRDGELRRLFKRVDQLDRELPLQTQRSMVPYENTLGGFEMFNTGVTDLSPELIGWYGAPGVNTSTNDCGCYQGCSQVKAGCKTTADCVTLTEAINGLNAAVAKSPIPACQGPGTTLFLVGDNFSVHDTKVIAGGICIPHVRLISRELMQVTIPHCINTVELCENGKTNKYVAIYIATPYGVTNHLHVPVMQQEGCGGDCSSSVVTRTENSVLDENASSLKPTESNANSMRPALVSLASNRTFEIPVRLSSMLQAPTSTDVTSEFIILSEKMEELKTRLDDRTLASTQTQVDVNVRYPASMTGPRDRELFDDKDFPVLGRFKTMAVENWRNCRDQLPGN